MPNDIPETFEIGELLSAAALNNLQIKILQRLADHDHTGAAKAAPLTTEALQDHAVTEPKLADGAISARTIADQAITADALADGAVGSANLASDAVTTDALADSAVTLAKLSADLREILLRVGGDASSVSQIIWRDPVRIFPATQPKLIFDAIKEPIKWSWDPKAIGLNAANEPIVIVPAAQVGGQIKTVDKNTFPAQSLTKIEAQINTATHAAALNMSSVNAVTLVDSFDEGRNVSTTTRLGRMPETTALSSPESAPVPEFSVRFNTAGEEAIRRMTTVSTVDADGNPKSADDPDAILVTSGFAGKGSFFRKGSSPNFRELNGANTNVLKEAAKGAGKILFNLGLDDDFAQDANDSAISSHLQLALKGDQAFFDVSLPLWQSGSWLADIFNEPQLFGTGYAVSGGVNIKSVTREYNPNDHSDHWVRVSFVTPYRNATYATTVTPRISGDYDMITAHIRGKSVSYVDLNFRGLKADTSAGTVSIHPLSKISFDLSVFGELEISE